MNSYYGLLQAFADALKLILKEYIAPTQANLVLFFLGPIITLIFALLGYAVIPYGPGLSLGDMELGILFMLAVSSLATYGILLAGWSANSKYAFLGSKWPLKDVSLYLKQTISEKFRKQYLLLILISTLYNSFICTLIFYFQFFFSTYSDLSLNQVKTESIGYSDLNNSNKLSPHFIIYDAEGSFIISIYKNNKTNSKLSWRVHPVFSLHLHIKDLELIKSIKYFFNVGVLTVNKANNKVHYTVNSVEDIVKVVIPYFDKYPLESKKYIDYMLFKSAVLLVKEKKHHIDKGLCFAKEVINIQASLNRGLTEILSANFPDTIPVNRPLSRVSDCLNYNWLLGFIEGEGCFFVSLSTNSLKTKSYVNLLFKITQHKRDIELIKRIANFLDCGFIIEQPNVSTVSLNCKKTSDILNKIIPFFDNYPLIGNKRLDYEDFYKIAILIKNNSHLTEQGLKNIKTGMNRGRVGDIIINNIQKRGLHSCIAGSLISPSVTPTKWGSKVKILLKMNNPQVTKAFNSLVGTSEAIRLLSILNKNCRFYRTKVHHTQLRNDKKWNQWLAGLIDGDGSFYLTKKGYASLEITMDIRDEHALQRIKNVYGGSIKLVSGAKALRYCLRHKEGFLALVNDVNGEIRNSYRLMQLNKICLKYDVALIYSDKLTYNNGWLSGFFDADGTVTLNSSNGQLAISLTQKTSEILQPLVNIYGGSIYIDRTSNNFKWYISDKEGILNLISYFKQYPPKSLKKNRLHLIPKCYELKEMGAHKALQETKPLLAKSWVLFKDKWAKYDE